MSSTVLDEKDQVFQRGFQDGIEAAKNAKKLYPLNGPCRDGLTQNEYIYGLGFADGWNDYRQNVEVEA